MKNFGFGKNTEVTTTSSYNERGKDSNEKANKKTKKKQKKTKDKSESSKKLSATSKKSSRVSFSNKTSVFAITSTVEDDENTINSNETSHYKNKNEADKEVPPTFTRFRFGASLETEKLLEILDKPKDKEQKEESELSPASKFRNILITLTTYIFSIDSESCIIS